MGYSSIAYKNFRQAQADYQIGTGWSLNNVAPNTHPSVADRAGYKEDFVANLIEGGQLGYGFKAGVFDAATPLAFPPAVIVVMQTPMMWDTLPDNGVLSATVKSMFECHAKNVTGIDINYNLDSGDQPLGHDGQTFKVPTQSKRAEVTPSFTWPEVTGNLVWNIIHRWIWDIQDPDTNAGLEFMSNRDLLPYTMSTYSLTFMAIQFDQTMHYNRIIDAAIYCNVYPQATGEMGIQRTIGTTEVKERAITFNGYVMHNKYTKMLGRVVAQNLNLRGETYLIASPNVDYVNPIIGRPEDHVSGIAADKDLTLTENAPGGSKKWAFHPGRDGLAGALDSAIGAVAGAFGF